MIPTFLQDIHLDSVLARYTSNVERYIVQSNKLEYVVDSETAKISGFVSSAFGVNEHIAGKSFLVRDSNNKDYALLQIDHASINSNRTSKCDCAIISDALFAFIEFKANATSTSNKAVKKNYKKAIKQLRTTTNYFRSGLLAIGIDFLLVRDVKAFVCFRRGYPHFSASEAQYRIRFATDTGGVPLYFTSSLDIP